MLVMELEYLQLIRTAVIKVIEKKVGCPEIRKKMSVKQKYLHHLHFCNLSNLHNKNYNNYKQKLEKLITILD